MDNNNISFVEADDCEYSPPIFLEWKMVFVGIIGLIVALISIIHNSLLFYTFNTSTVLRKRNLTYLMWISGCDVFISICYIAIMCVQVTSSALSWSLRPLPGLHRLFRVIRTACPLARVPPCGLHSLPYHVISCFFPLNGCHRRAISTKHCRQQDSETFSDPRNSPGLCGFLLFLRKSHIQRNCPFWNRGHNNRIRSYHSKNVYSGCLPTELHGILLDGPCSCANVWREYGRCMAIFHSENSYRIPAVRRSAIRPSSANHCVSVLAYFNAAIVMNVRRTDRDQTVKALVLFITVGTRCVLSQGECA